ncbi:MAG: peptidase S41, partial [Flavobacterium sp.]
DEIRKVMDSLQFLAINNSNKMVVEIDDNIPKQLIGDKLRLSQIFVNLISNSLKFTKNGEIKVSAVLEKRLDQLPQIAACKSCSDKTKQPSLVKPNYGELLTGKVLNQSLINKISFILNNAQIEKNYYISMAPGVGNPIFKNEKPYANMAYPDAGYRILAVFRYWNMINYFFPYKDIIGEDWNQVLPEMLPVFIAAKDRTQYAKAALKLFAKINDTHAYASGLERVVNAIRGKNTTPFRAKFVGDQLIVYDYFNTQDSIKKNYRIGDEILMINGEKVTDLIKMYDPFVAASNYDTKLRTLPLGFLLRSNNEIMQLTIKRDEQLMKQTCRLIDYNSTYNTKNPTIQSHKIINGNIGYVYPGSYKNASLPEITKLFENTKGIVVDMRCYPSDFMPFTFGNYLKRDKTPFVKFTMGSVAAPGTFRMGNEISNGGNKNAYKGKIIVIVNSESQSNAEYTTMAFQSSPNVKVIGSQTAGADGNVSTIVLPGGISSWISGIGVFYPDGTPTQRVGVKIDYPITPTVKGIRDGKDELLEKAMELLEKGW